MYNAFQWFNQQLQKPLNVLIVSVAIAIISLVMEGSLYSFLSLRSTEKELDQRILELQISNKEIQNRLQQTKKLDFLERQARDQLDLVADDEIVFVFSNDTQ